jgi:hypothetical protein
MISASNSLTLLERTTILPGLFVSRLNFLLKIVLTFFGRYSNTLLVLLNNRASPGRVVALSRDSNNASSPNAYSPNSVRLGPLTQNPRPFMIPGRMKVVSPPLPPLHEDVDVQPVYSRREGNGVPRWGQTTRASLDLDVYSFFSCMNVDPDYCVFLFFRNIRTDPGATWTSGSLDGSCSRLGWLWLCISRIL